MRKIKVATGILVAIVLATLTASAALALPRLPENTGTEIARGKSPVIDDTGEVKAPPTVPVFPQLPESELTRIVFIRFAPGFQKDKPCDGDGVCDPDEKGWCSDCKGGGEEPEASPCYGFLAGSKPRWNWVEDYSYSDLSLVDTSASAASTWESATSGDIFGNGVSETYEWGVYDYKNSLSYGDYDDTGMCPTEDPCVIAVTAIWFRGKNIYEYDIQFDTDFFPGDFDLPTVTLHEFGHAAGLDDLYDSVCSGNVMYGYYTGEKTTLGEGDTAGIQKLYGK